MAKNKRTTKSEYKELVELGEGDSLYFDSVTIENWVKIYNFLVDKSKLGKNIFYSMSKISKETKINSNQVRWAIFMGLKTQKLGRPKLIRCRGMNFNGKISNQVQLIAYFK